MVSFEYTIKDVHGIHARKLLSRELWASCHSELSREIQLSSPSMDLMRKQSVLQLRSS